MSKKIYLNKSDSTASAIDKILKADDDEVILYIPREAEVAESKKDLQLLQREVEAAGKTFKVESVDDDTIEKVLSLGIDATNPFLGRGKKTVSDIVVQRGRIPVRVSAPRKASKPGRAKRGRSVVGLGLTDDTGEETEMGTYKAPREGMSKGKKRLIWLGSGLLGVALVVGAAIFLPRVTVTIALDKTEHGYIGSLKVSPAFEESTVSENTLNLRGVVFSSEKNITDKYAANGTDSVGRKARGTITIYNNFGTDAQSLVATTRFVTPDGKIYRLDSNVTVPGAKKDGDKLVASHVEATVTADQPGEEYNIGSVPKFRIPGFQGSSKYEGFYAESKGTMSGGSFGETKVPTDEDLKSAKADLQGRLEDALKTEFFVGLPSNIKVLEGAYDIEITREQVNDVVDKDGKFSLTLYGQIKLIGFDEAELVDTLRKKFEADDKLTLQIYDYTVDYGEVSIDFTKEELGSAVKFGSNWTRPFDAAEFAKKIVGMKGIELKTEILSTPGVRSGEVKMWPFWVNRVPKDLSRISVDAK
ncbi:MAG: hypothetical protein UX31_C0006G0057 [Candidatus Nomurabacteria bacterium GW2011_GWA1_46_11]|uniref:GlxA-like beta barrel domain-containing protein n=2 Tax=Parcubacteria group TaxID=1794811 RepID=A0A1G1YVF0_9BACT|nr:MAG: hypothetical protein UX29_C0008G0060 [Parcubacteria group bacterium GW2011_GWA2_46_10]KKU22145.1 MAG: hypothetical protein UX31_C0006G0057 [Candidatus Nomurabacteria bacterium GW2011_GWA1_46_11]OGY56209.1 MAG: hypothetical protein A2119_01105 [Candidatus Colwellbacteria bacterium GWA2_46_10]